MDLGLFLQPSNYAIGLRRDHPAHTIGEMTRFHQGDQLPDLTGVRIAIIGVLDDPGHEVRRGCINAPDHVREHLYALFAPQNRILLADLGDIHPGATSQDTQHALAATVADLVNMNIVPIILGGGQGLTLGQYLAYEQLERTANLVCIDPRFDLGEAGQEVSETSYLSHIIMRQPNFLFNFSALAYQTYLVDQPSIELMDKLYFDIHRLGELRESIAEAEPVLRNADSVSIDMSVVRHSDAAGTSTPGPNGLYAEEICQLCRYAGTSEKLSSLGIYEIDPERDKDNITSELAAQMVWCFMDGMVARTNDLPWLDRKRFTRFRVPVKEHEQELVFFKSNSSDRWWMDIPFRADHEAKFERHHLVPCSYADYQMACKEEVPDRWWRTFQKLA